MEKDDISQRSADSEAMLPYWKKVASIIGGEDAVKEAGEEYLKKHVGETKQEYEFRLSVAKFTNIYRDVVENLAAKPFEEEIEILGESVPTEVKDFAEDVDGDGENLTVFAGNVFFNGINDAITWIFIDYPNTEPGTIRTRAEAKAANLRPYWINVLAQNVLEARVTKFGGKIALSYIRFLEPGSDKKSDKIKVFELIGGRVGWSVYQKNDKQEWFKVSDGFLTVTEVPFVPFITGRRDGKRFFFRPALQDAVNLQMTLYRQESDLEYAKKMTAFPMLSASGVKPERNPDNSLKTIQTGPNSVLWAPPDGSGQSGNWSYVEPNAGSLKFLAEDVKETKQDLRELGKQPLTAQAGLTVITTAYAAGKSKTAVGAWGLALKNALEEALLITCAYLSVQYEPEVAVYDEYDNFSTEDFSSILTMREKRDISQETLWIEAKRRGILSSEFDKVKELEKLLSETPSEDTTNDVLPPRLRNPDLPPGV